MIVGEMPPPKGAFGVDAIAMTMRFGDFLALDNVELKVRPGTFHALLGENGAGKSTLVKCIMGYYHPTEGDVLVVAGKGGVGRTTVAAALAYVSLAKQQHAERPAQFALERLRLEGVDVDTWTPNVSVAFASESATA